MSMYEEYKQLANMNETLPSKGHLPTLMQGALLILFPPTPASDWSYPSIEMGDFLWDAFLAIRSGENVYMLAHLPSNARAAEITIITATNTKKQLIWLLKSRNLFLRSIFSSNRF
ncbi:hypothetical protein RhiirA1_448146 [Rhizophagus irregularis]|uniref:Uncharacterized protein n=1 Tax=Rhizophagus irregularis TaxID=588596 RepID=A0A2N0SK66_9GLOM|nr:hypothetical protein RhiirA1_448146 [Rhizophagus irregularis]